MYFDRNDICAAWNLYLQRTQTGQDSEKYKRLCKLQKHFKPSWKEQYEEGLTENAQIILNNLFLDKK
jgi:hypothetical protein